MAKTLDEIVERVARALYEAAGGRSPSAPSHSFYLGMARATLTALARAHALVPREASEEMVRAAFGWREKDSREGLTGEVDMFERALSCAVSASDLLASLREGK